jgi:hypothetical protein
MGAATAVERLPNSSKRQKTQLHAGSETGGEPPLPWATRFRGGAQFHRMYVVSGHHSEPMTGSYAADDDDIRDGLLRYA